MLSPKSFVPAMLVQQLGCHLPQQKDPQLTAPEVQIVVHQQLEQAPVKTKIKTSFYNFDCLFAVYTDFTETCTESNNIQGTREDTINYSIFGVTLFGRLRNPFSMW